MLKKETNNETYITIITTLKLLFPQKKKFKKILVFFLISLGKKVINPQ